MQFNRKLGLLFFCVDADVTNIKSITNAAPEYQMFYRVASSCFFGPRGEYGQELFKKIIKMSQQICFEIVSSTVASCFLVKYLGHYCCCEQMFGDTRIPQQEHHT
jgi:hypothetical protein